MAHKQTMPKIPKPKCLFANFDNRVKRTTFPCPKHWGIFLFSEGWGGVQLKTKCQIVLPVSLGYVFSMCSRVRELPPARNELTIFDATRFKQNKNKRESSQTEIEIGPSGDQALKKKHDENLIKSRWIRSASTGAPFYIPCI
ncbi:hypothetical protein OUZ56_002651 [Daphnia magna]|uniref:Uncharacterized protein n=1 Tax=Daphnia magna TaxID=35525 RepID=A0ABR0A6D3_9CRUS|nr:hypothetical protein OUZ56_002651 [Daphnia magna]